MFQLKACLPSRRYYLAYARRERSENVTSGQTGERLRRSPAWTWCTPCWLPECTSPTGVARKPSRTAPARPCAATDWAGSANCWLGNDTSETQINIRIPTVYNVYVVHTHTQQLLLNLPFVNWPDTIPAVQLTLAKQSSARQDDTPPADRSGSTSVCGQTSSQHSPGSLQGSCGQLEQTDRQTDRSIT